MSLRIRRGTEAQRTGATFDLGEIVYATDTNKLYVGDGVNLGGKNILATSAGTGLIWNATTQRLDFNGSGTGIVDVQADATPSLGGNLNLNSRNITGTGNISITGTVTATTFVGVPSPATLTQNLSLNTRTITGTGTIDIVGTIRATTGLGGNLPLNGSNINGTGNINITGGITATSDITCRKLILNNSLNDSGILIETNIGGDGMVDGGITIKSYHDDTVPTTMKVARSRGTFASPTALLNGDNIFAFSFLGRTPGNSIVTAGAIGVEAAGTISAGVCPGKIVFWTTNSTGDFTQKLGIGPDGLQTTVAPALVAGASAGQVNTGTISSWMKINFNGTNYAVPMYAIRP